MPAKKENVNYYYLQWKALRHGLTVNAWIGAGFKYVEALGRIIIGGPYPPSNAIIYMHLQL